MGRIRVSSVLDYLAPAGSAAGQTRLPFARVPLKTIRNNLKHSINIGKPLADVCDEAFTCAVPELITELTVHCRQVQAAACVALLSKPPLEIDEQDCLLAWRWISDEIGQHLFERSDKYMVEDAAVRGVSRPTAALLDIAHTAEGEGRASAAALVAHLNPLKESSQRYERIKTLARAKPEDVCAHLGIEAKSDVGRLQIAYLRYVQLWMDSVLDAHERRPRAQLPPMLFRPFQWLVLPHSVVSDAARKIRHRMDGIDQVKLVNLMTHASGGVEMPVHGISNFAQTTELMLNEHNHPTAGDGRTPTPGPEHTPAAHAAVIKRHLRLYPALLRWPAALLSSDGEFGFPSRHPAAVTSLQRHPNFGPLYDTIIRTLTDMLQREHTQDTQHAQAAPGRNAHNQQQAQPPEPQQASPTAGAGAGPALAPTSAASVAPAAAASAVSFAPTSAASAAPVPPANRGERIHGRDDPITPLHAPLREQLLTTFPVRGQHSPPADVFVSALPLLCEARAASDTACALCLFKCARSFFIRIHSCILTF